MIQNPDFKNQEESLGHTEELEALRLKAAQAAEHLDQARRARADLLNLQDQVRRDKELHIREVFEGFMRAFVPTLDSFARVSCRHPALLDALGILEREIVRVLGKHGVRPIETDGGTFDPRLHEALEWETRDDVSEGTILKELSKGWTLGTNVLRRAGVRVSRTKAEDIPSTPA